MRAPARTGFVPQIYAVVLEDRRRLAQVAGWTLVGALLSLGASWLSKLAIDEALPASAPRLLTVLAGASVATGLARAWARWVEERASTYVSARAEQVLLERLVTTTLYSNSRTEESHSTGALTETLSAAGRTLHAYLGALGTLTTHGCFAATYFVALTFVSPIASLAICGCSLLVAALTWVYLPREANRLRRALVQSARQAEGLHTVLANLTAIRALRTTDRFGQWWEETLSSSTQASLAHSQSSLARSTLGDAGSRLIQLGIVLWLVYRCLRADAPLGDLLLLMVVAGGLSASVLCVCEAWADLRSSRPLLERVDAVLNGGQRTAQSPPTVQQRPGIPALVVDSLWHRYHSTGRWVVQGKDLRVHLGQVVRLEGASGTGKSTLLQLIAGLLTPVAGAIQIFGQEIACAQHLVLYVPQRSSLFEGTILDNLLLLSGANQTKIEQVSQHTGLSKLLESLPMGLHTPVASNGENLSSGQRQLIVLTAALACNRPILLLDEATSQLDEPTRNRIDWAQLLKDKAAVVVDHH